MFTRKLKLEKHHRKLFRAFAKEFDMSFDEAGLVILEKGFSYIKMLSENDNKIIECSRIYQNDESTMKMINFFNELWKSGKQ